MTETRNQKILAFKKSHDWSYQLIAEKFGVTKNVVAGLLFRERHEYSKRVSSPRGNGGNKIGTGYRSGPFPKRFKSSCSKTITVRE